MNTAPIHEITIQLNSTRVAESIMRSAKIGFSSCLSMARDSYQLGFKSDAARAINYAGEYRAIYAKAKDAHALLSGVA